MGRNAVTLRHGARPDTDPAPAPAAGPPPRPRLLFLSQTLPYPPDAGVKIRTYHLLRELAQAFDIVALCFCRSSPGRYPEDAARGVAGLRPLARVEAFPIPQEHSTLRLLWDHARSLATGRAYTVFSYESRPFRRRLAELLRTQEFDLVHLDSLDLSPYLPALPGLPVVCGHHDAQSVLLRRRARLEPNPARAAYVALQARLTAREERRWCGRVACNITVSPVDSDALAALAPDARFAVIPNGVDTTYFRPEPGADDGLVFVGGTSWLPNRDALHHFAAEILPRLHALGVHARVRWVGRTTVDERRRWDAQGIELTGYVEDVRPYVRDAACYVVPIRAGSGTRVKILDAWAMGKAVVSTSVGCEGLAARDGENILVRDDPEEFARAVRDVLCDPDLRRRLGENARRTAERLYDWRIIGNELRARYLELASRRATANGRTGAATATGTHRP